MEHTDTTTKSNDIYDVSDDDMVEATDVAMRLDGEDQKLVCADRKIGLLYATPSNSALKSQTAHTSVSTEKQTVSSAQPTCIPEIEPAV